MYRKRLFLLATVIVLCLLTACAGLFSPDREAATPEPSGPETGAPTATIPAETDQEVTEAPPVQDEIEVVTATPTAVAMPAAVAEGVYYLNQQTTSEHRVLADILLVLYQATLTSDSLILRIGFRNSTDNAYGVIGGTAASTFRLVDAAGREYQPAGYSENLERINPPGNFAPGQANVGDVTFPRPTGAAPYELQFPQYDPLVFRLEEATTVTLPPAPEGVYSLELELYSGQRVLAPIRLRLDTVTITAETLIFDVAFVNTRRQGYDLLLGPKGGDARLLDAENASYEPANVSDNLVASIAPDGGWLSGQAHSGQIIFPRPQRMEQVRFVFPQYAAATLQFDASGLVDAALSSASGAPPPPTPTPSPAEVALRELDELLDEQAQAVLDGNLDAYLATFIPELHEEQATIFEQGRLLPFNDYKTQVSLSTSLPTSDLQAGRLRNVTVQIRYHLRATPDDNPFQRQIRYDFEQRNGRWLITGYSLSDHPPFWWTGEVIVQETPHFWIIARPEMAAEMAQLAEECEQAYSDLLALGFNLEPRLVAYFTAVQADFTAQTGMGTRVLGIALSLYDLTGDEIETLGRAFYVNGEAFQEQAGETGSFGRLATIKHELVHVALAKETRPFTPPWLIEGAAVYYAGQNTPEGRQFLVEQGNLETISLARLTTAGSLGAHDLLGHRVGQEYVYSGEVTRYLIETYGEEAFLKLYGYYTGVPAAAVRDRMPIFALSISVSAAFANLSQELTSEALQEIYGLSIEELDTAVKEWLWEQVP